MTDQPTLLDKTMPDPDYTLIEHMVLPVTADVAYEAIGSLDLADVRDPVTRVALWLRGLPERLRRRVPPTRMTFDDLVIGTDWVLLGERTGHEIALGAAGRFWTPVIRWIPVRPDEFADFEKPGFGRIGMAFSVRPYGDHRSVVTYEVRTALPDPATRRAFGRYWFTVRPFVRQVSRGMLKAIRDRALLGGSA